MKAKITRQEIEKQLDKTLYAPLYRPNVGDPIVHINVKTGERKVVGHYTEHHFLVRRK